MQIKNVNITITYINHTKQYWVQKYFTVQMNDIERISHAHFAESIYVDLR